MFVSLQMTAVSIRTGLSSLFSFNRVESLRMEEREGVEKKKCEISWDGED